ncbi:MAG: ribosome maturation factor RimM [Acidimicrobiales bacterium]
MTGDRLFEVGRILKPHGLRGEVVVELVTDRTERLAPGSRLETDKGRLTVDSSRPYQGRYIVRFDEVGDRDAADEARGLVLRAEPIDDPDALWVHELLGATVVLPGGESAGVVTTVEASAADDLLVLDTGAVVPVTFVRGWDADRRLVIDPPVGLLDL